MKDEEIASLSIRHIVAPLPENEITDAVKQLVAERMTAMVRECEKNMFGFPVEVDDSIPPDEIHLRYIDHSGRSRVGIMKIINLDGC